MKKFKETWFKLTAPDRSGSCGRQHLTRRNAAYRISKATWSGLLRVCTKRFPLKTLRIKAKRLSISSRTSGFNRQHVCHAKGIH